MVKDLMRPQGAWVDRRTIAFLVVVAMVQCAVYATHPNSPIRASPDADWFGWWDQSQYLASSKALAAGDLSPEKHWYPPGYSALGALFVGALPRHPYFVINLASTLIFASAFLTYFRPVIGYVATVAAFFAGLLIPVAIWLPFRMMLPFWLQFAIPWNSVPVAAAFMVILVMMRGLRDTGSVWRDFALGSSAGLIAVTRPIDVIPLAPVGIVYLWQRLVPVRRWGNAAAGVCGAAAVIVPAIALTVAIFGGLNTPYQDVSRGIGLSLDDLPQRAIAVLLDPSIFGERLGLFRVAPLLFVAPPFAAVWAVFDRRNGTLPVVVVVTSIVTYLAYNDFSPLNVFRFMLVHYIVWTVPVLVAAGMAGFAILIRNRNWIFVIFLGIVSPLLLASVRFKEKSVRMEAVEIHRTGPDGMKYDIAFSRHRGSMPLISSARAPPQGSLSPSRNSTFAPTVSNWRSSKGTAP